LKKAPTVFLDANVLFSAALGGATFALLFEIARRGRIRLITSAGCQLEAEGNLVRKRGDRVGRLHEILRDVDVTDPDVEAHISWAASLVPAGDVHVLAAARASNASVLVTGDVSHFGALMDRQDLPFRVRTPRAFLLEGPSPS